MLNLFRSRPLLRYIAILTCLLTNAASAINSESGTQCDHDCLIDVMNTYLDAMVVLHDPKAAPLSPHVKSTENGQSVPVGEGLWKTVGAVPYRQIFADAQTGEVGLNAVANEGGTLAVFSVRLKVLNHLISEVETLIARKGRTLGLAPELMVEPDRLYEDLVPPQKRVPRAEMIAAANAYYEGVERADPSIVPAAPGCYRVENGGHTERVPAAQLGGHCKLGLKKVVARFIKTIRNRRYPLVDEERGLVWALTVMDFQPAPAKPSPDELAPTSDMAAHSMLVYEVFKIVDGRIRRIEVTLTYLPKDGSSGWPS